MPWVCRAARIHHCTLFSSTASSSPAERAGSMTRARYLSSSRALRWPRSCECARSGSPPRSAPWRNAGLSGRSGAAGATLTRSIWPVWNPWTTRTTSVPPSLRTRGRRAVVEPRIWRVLRMRREPRCPQSRRICRSRTAESAALEQRNRRF